MAGRPEKPDPTGETQLVKTCLCVLLADMVTMDIQIMLHSGTLSIPLFLPLLDLDLPQ